MTATLSTSAGTPSTRPSTVAAVRSPGKKSFQLNAGSATFCVRSTTFGVVPSCGMFDPYWYVMSGCSLPWSATVSFWSAKSLFTYRRVTWMPGWVRLNSSTRLWSETHSYASLTGGGGV